MASGSKIEKDHAAYCKVSWTSSYNGGASYTITFTISGGTTESGLPSGMYRNCWAYIDYGSNRILNASAKLRDYNYNFGSASITVNANEDGSINLSSPVVGGVGFYSESLGDLEGVCTFSSIAVEQPVTAPTAPTTVSLGGGAYTITNRNGIYGSSYSIGRSTLSWSGASRGYNNNIVGYTIYRSINGGSYAEIGTTNASTTSLAVDVSGLANGQYATYAIITRGSSSNSGFSGGSIRFYRNIPPYAPTGRTTYVPSYGGSTPLNYSAGSSPNGFGVSTYYSTSVGGGKTAYNGQALAAGTYYLWSHDGLDFSSSYGTASVVKDTAAPTVSNITYSNSDFIPYYDEGKGYEYVVNAAPIITGTHGQHSSITNYLFYYRQSSSASSLSGIGEVYLTQSNSNSISFAVNNYITAGNYFQVGAKVQTSLGEVSGIKWSHIMCCGSPITAADFTSELIIDSLIDNDKKSITDNTGILLYFNKWIKLGWSNPSNKINKFRISNIECGIYTGGNFTPVSIYTSAGAAPTINLGNNSTNSNIYLDIGDTVSRGAEINLAIRITSENGQISIKQGAKRTRTVALGFNGIYNVSIPEWKYFLDNSEINFNGNKVTGDNGFAVLKSATITSVIPLNKTYEATYSTDASSIPGHFNFKDEAIFKTETNSDKTDNVINNTYIITIIDRYGNSANTTISQIIDFRVAPSFATGAVLTTKVAYLNAIETYNIINTDTNVAYRILNPGEKIQISWPEATDSGNSETQTMRYQVEAFNIPNITSLSTSGGTKFLTEIITATSYTYTAPAGTNTAQGIYFNVTALDQSDLTSKTLSTSSSQALALGRALSPEFTVVNYSIEEEGANAGMLSGKVKISDYGDSRIIVSSWKNYDRLGLTLTELGGKLDEEQNSILVTLSYDDATGLFSSQIGDYPTKDKITLNFTLSINYLSLFSEQHYIFSFNGPTFSYRAHQVGINASADNVNNTSLIIGPGVADGINKHLIRLIINKVGWQDVDIDLYEGTIKNIIIDGGTWD